MIAIIIAEAVLGLIGIICIVEWWPRYPRLSFENTDEYRRYQHSLLKLGSILLGCSIIGAILLTIF